MVEYGDSFNSRSMGKIIQTDYDTSIGNDQECVVCLTNGQINALLAIVDYFSWKTRWYSFTQEIDLVQIRLFTGDLTRRLINVCCCGDNQSSSSAPEEYYVRLDENGYQETSNDGGETWEQNTQSDYRFNGGIFPRPDTASLGDEPACSYTINLVAQIEKSQQAYNAQWEIGDSLTGLIAAIVTALGTWGLVLTGLLPTLLITAIVVAVLSIGRVAWNAAFTAGFYSELKCAILPNMPSNGVWSASGWDALLIDIDAMTFSIARVWTWNLVRAMGSGGLTNASSIPSWSEDTCEECGEGWCFDDNFVEAQYSWLPRFAIGHDYATWLGDQFEAVTLTWNAPPTNTHSTLQVEKTGSGSINSMTVFFSGMPTAFDIEIYLGGSLVHTESLTGYISGVEIPLPDVTFDMLRPVLYSTAGSAMNVTRILTGGTGAAPYSGGTC